jgi:ATP-dependent Clp protease ATP-binding subunit ClpX
MFTDEALRAIAELAIKRRSGARGLRAIMERVMLDVMFDVPSRSDVRVVTITAQTVHGEAPAQYTASAELGGVS